MFKEAPNLSCSVSYYDKIGQVYTVLHIISKSAPLCFGKTFITLDRGLLILHLSGCMLRPTFLRLQEHQCKYTTILSLIGDSGNETICHVYNVQQRHVLFLHLQIPDKDGNILTIFGGACILHRECSLYKCYGVKMSSYTVMKNSHNLK